VSHVEKTVHALSLTTGQVNASIQLKIPADYGDITCSHLNRNGILSVGTSRGYILVFPNFSQGSVEHSMTKAGIQRITTNLQLLTFNSDFSNQNKPQLPHSHFQHRMFYLDIQ
jgi:hypothetical protein